MSSPIVSLVIPCYNEEGNLRPLMSAIVSSIRLLNLAYEIIVTDDCSTDKSWEILKELAAADAHIRAQRFAFNCGESAASWAGLKAARGKYLVTFDDDLQNDPKDLPKFLEALKAFDCVCGTRVQTRGEGDNFLRSASSRLVNWVRNTLSGEQITDAGCTYRAFKRECIQNVKFFEGMHRFLPTLFRIEGFTVTEIQVGNNRRFAGQSQYGVWNRLFASFYDSFAVRWMKKRMTSYEIAEKFQREPLVREGQLALSVVVPCHNEQENLRPLINAIQAVVDGAQVHYEIIITDDRSTDQSWEILKDLAENDSRIYIQRFARNSGQSAALWAGMKAARGCHIATLDADLQNDPADLPRLLDGLKAFDCVCGSRVAARRQGDNLVRSIASRIANWVRNRISGENISDSACCFRAFKRECISELKYFRGMHRFMATLVRMDGFTVTEVPIRQNPRAAGSSHYTIGNRLFASFYDLLAVCWMKNRMCRYQISETVEKAEIQTSPGRGCVEDQPQQRSTLHL